MMTPALAISDATVWSVTDDARVVIYDCNMSIIQATGGNMGQEYVQKLLFENYPTISCEKQAISWVKHHHLVREWLVQVKDLGLMKLNLKVRLDLNCKAKWQVDQMTLHQEDIH